MSENMEFLILSPLILILLYVLGSIIYGNTPCPLGDSHNFQYPAHKGGVISFEDYDYCIRCKKAFKWYYDGIDVAREEITGEEKEKYLRAIGYKEKLIIKKELKKKGDHSMPRIFKYIFWIMVLILFWKFVSHIDQIVLFFIKGGI